MGERSQRQKNNVEPTDIKIGQDFQNLSPVASSRFRVASGRSALPLSPGVTGAGPRRGGGRLGRRALGGSDSGAWRAGPGAGAVGAGSASGRGFHLGWLACIRNAVRPHDSMRSRMDHGNFVPYASRSRRSERPLASVHFRQAFLRSGRGKRLRSRRRVRRRASTIKQAGSWPSHTPKASKTSTKSCWMPSSLANPLNPRQATHQPPVPDRPRVFPLRARARAFNTPLWPSPGAYRHDAGHMPRRGRGSPSVSCRWTQTTF